MALKVRMDCVMESGITVTVSPEELEMMSIVLCGCVARMQNISLDVFRIVL